MGKPRKCIFCKGETLIKTHQEELDKLLNTELELRQSSPWSATDQHTFCNANFDKVLDAGDTKSVNISYLEEKYMINHPQWITSLQCYPKGLDHLDERPYKWVEEIRKSPNTTRRGFYNEVIGKLGEDLVQKSFFQAFKDAPALLLSNFEFGSSTRKYKQLRPVQKSLKRIFGTNNINAELDVMVCYPSENKLIFKFVQIKTLDIKDSSSHENVKERVQNALEQTIMDIKCFLVLFPDLSAKDLKMIEFQTFAALPSTKKIKSVCGKCSEHILFRDDFTPNYQGGIKTLSVQIY